MSHELGRIAQSLAVVDMLDGSSEVLEKPSLAAQSHWNLRGSLVSLLVLFIPLVDLAWCRWGRILADGLTLGMPSNVLARTTLS